MAKPRHSLLSLAGQLRLLLMVGQWRRSFTLGALVFLVLLVFLLIGLVDFFSDVE